MRYLSAAVLLLALAACEPMPPIPHTPLVFGQPYAFNVATIRVTEDYVPSREPPHVEELADVAPDQAVRQWAQSRLTAAGRSGSLEIDVTDASIVKKDIPKEKTGLEGFFTKEQTEEYDGHLIVTLKIYNGVDIMPVAHARAEVHQELSLREDATAYDRQAITHQMTVQLMQALQAEMDRNIHQYFRNYLM